jgi:hypothetical protein
MVEFVSIISLIYIKFSCNLLLFVNENVHGNAKIDITHTRYKNHFNIVACRPVVRQSP